MIFCRRFRACSGLGSPSFVVMIRRMCGFTSPSRSASRVRLFGVGLSPGLRRGAGFAAHSGRRAPSAVLSAGACVSGPALRRRPFAGSPPGGACLAAYSGRRDPSAVLSAGACARVRPLGAGLLPGLRRGACLAAHSGRRDPSRVFPPERPLEARPSALCGRPAERCVSRYLRFTSTCS